MFLEALHLNLKCPNMGQASLAEYVLSHAIFNFTSERELIYEALWGWQTYTAGCQQLP